MTSILDQPWFPVGAPWGDGTLIVAGHEDPHVGALVVDCGNVDEEERPGVDGPAELAAHICKIHNTDLARRALERKIGVRD